jgi:hypothetical protein
VRTKHLVPTGSGSLSFSLLRSHREEVLARDRERAAKRRARLNALKPGDDELEAARQRARESSARYRER